MRLTLITNIPEKQPKDSNIRNLVTQQVDLYFDFYKRFWGLFNDRSLKEQIMPQPKNLLNVNCSQSLILLY